MNEVKVHFDWSARGNVNFCGTLRPIGVHQVDAVFFLEVAKAGQHRFSAAI